jgi:hypothetical protein
MLAFMFILFEFVKDVFIDIIFVVLDITLFVLLHYLNFYILACEIRTSLFWFLNINPYLYPWNKLTNLTKFMSQFGSKIYPTVFGVNVGFYINLFLLRKVFVYVHMLYHFNTRFRHHRFQMNVPTFLRLSKTP